MGERTYELKHPNGYVLGYAVEDVTGWWRFLPRVSGRRPSAKTYPSADACLPPWARRRLKEGCSFLLSDVTPAVSSGSRRYG